MALRLLPTWHLTLLSKVQVWDWFLPFLTTMYPSSAPYGTKINKHWPLQNNRNIVVGSAELEVTNPTGQTVVIPMNDEGRFTDAAPGDGYFTGSVSVPMAGTYLIEAKLDGKYVDTTSLTETYVRNCLFTHWKVPSNVLHNILLRCRAFLLLSFLERED